MAAQKIMTKKYRDELFQETKDGVGLERYTRKVFPLDENRLGETMQVSAPLDLLNKMNPKDDFQSAVALFEAYKSIPLIVAGNPIFWETLAHNELFSYVQNRWPVENADPQNHVMNHWFVTKGLIRHSLSGLWWAIKCSYDDTADNPYELSEILFKNYSFRTTFYGASTLVRSKSATLGILSFFKDNPDLLISMENTGRFITSYFNKLGATKQLAFLSKEYYKNELTRIKPEILKIKNREDLAASIASIIE